MAQITLPKGIASISGKVGNIVFYFRNGKQYARRLDKTSSAAIEAITPDNGSIIPR